MQQCFAKNQNQFIFSTPSSLDQLHLPSHNNRANIVKDLIFMSAYCHIAITLDLAPKDFSHRTQHMYTTHCFICGGNEVITYP